MSYCKCCGHIVEGQWCEICSFIEPSYSDIASSEKNSLEHAVAAHKRTKEYKEGILSNTVISIKASLFQWDQKRAGYELIREAELFDPDLTGIRASQSIIRSKEWIAHFEGRTTIDVAYTFAGKRKSVTAELSPKPSEGYWYPCIHINNNLQLEIGLAIVPVNGAGRASNELLATVALDYTV